MRLVKLDSQGLDYFGDTTADFWRSFLAAAVVIPLFLLYLVIRYVGSDTDGSLPVPTLSPSYWPTLLPGWHFR